MPPYTMPCMYYSMGDFSSWWTNPNPYPNPNRTQVTLFLVDEAGMPLGHASLYTSLIFLSNMCVTLLLTLTTDPDYCP